METSLQTMSFTSLKVGVSDLLILIIFRMGRAFGTLPSICHVGFGSVGAKVPLPP